MGQLQNHGFKLKTALFILGILMLSAGCSRQKTEYYHKFTDHTWNRFSILTFDIPVEGTNTPYDIVFFAHHTREYEFDNLNFNMIMNTPSGEERIKEYSFILKRFGSFTGKCNTDSCEAEITLKSGMIFPEKGILKIEIETIVPRVQIRGLLGVGIRLVPGR